MQSVHGSASLRVAAAVQYEAKHENQPHCLHLKYLRVAYVIYAARQQATASPGHDNTSVQALVFWQACTRVLECT